MLDYVRVKELIARLAGNHTTTEAAKAHNEAWKIKVAGGCHTRGYNTPL